MNDIKKKNANSNAGSNADLEGDDKAPGEEQGKSELVTNADLKGKKNDGDPATRKDQPLDNK